MGRKNIKEIRRAEIVTAFSRVLAKHGYSGTTMTAVGEAAGVAPGLLHHNFQSKKEMLTELFRTLEIRFKRRFEERKKESPDALSAYLDASLRLDHRADLGTAKCWVGIFAEAIRDPDLFQMVKHFLGDHVQMISDSSEGTLDDHDSSAILAFMIGSLVYGAFSPKKTAGFALPSAEKLVQALKKTSKRSL